MIVASEQWLTANGQLPIENGEQPPREDYSPTNTERPGQPATQLDIERLKLIDEISRLILELNKEIPESAEHLSKARANFSASKESIPIKDLTNLLRAIQQNLNVFKPELAEAIKNLVIEAAKILQPREEVPTEYKLIIALSKNDFVSVNAAIKNIIANSQTATPQTAVPQATIPQATAPQTTVPQATVPQAATPQTTTPQAAIPQTTAPQATVPQATTPQITVPQTAVPQATVPQATAPQTTVPQATIPQAATPQITVPQTTVPQATTPQAAISQAATPQTAAPQIAAPQATVPQATVPQTTVPQATVPQAAAPQATTPQITVPQAAAPQTTVPQTTVPQAAITEPAFRTIFNALQELKELGIPRELQNSPLKELETIVLQKTGIEIPKKMAEDLSIIFSEKPTFAAVSLKTNSTNQNRLQVTPLISQHTNQKIEFEIPLPKNAPLQKILENIPQNSVQNTPQKIEMAFSLHTVPLHAAQTQAPAQIQLFILQPWSASAEIPKAERDFWQKTELPLTPQILNIRNTILSFDRKLPENPEVARMFAGSMHELSLLTEYGADISKEQANLLWRIVRSQQQTLSPQLTTSFLKYQPAENYEGELFKNLPEPIKKELLRELPTGKTWLPETLQNSVEKILENKPHEETRSILQNFKEQIQWTRIDQDTRPQNDKENVFYFMHEGELQKGRLKIKDERGKASGKKSQDSPISFSIETKTKNLGNVHADLTLSKNILNIRIQDETGIALDAVNEERETLAKELADIGISLGELIYGKALKVQILPIAKKEKSTGRFDVKA
jgi:hypothetical protein